MKLTYNICFLFVYVFHSWHDAEAQCPGREKWMDSVYSVEQSDEDNPGKIARFTDLEKRYRDCFDGDDSVVARIIHRLGDLHRLEGDFEQGIQFTRQAIQINKRGGPLGQAPFLTNSYYNLGLYHQLLGLAHDAHLYFDSCIHAGSRFPEKLFIVQMAFERKAFLYFKIGDYSNSVATADRGIYLAQKEGDPIREALLLMQRAQARLELNQLPSAEQDADRAMKLLRVNQGDEYFANIYSVRANILSRKKNYQEAITLYKSAYETNAEVENWEQCVRDLQDLGYLYDFELHDSKNALASYRMAMKYADRSSDRYARATLFNNIAMVYAREKDFARALIYLQEGLMSLPLSFNKKEILENPDTIQLSRATNDYVVMTLLANKAENQLKLFHKTQEQKWLQSSLETFLLVDRVIDQMRWRQNEDQSRMFWRERTRKWYALAVEVCYLLRDVENGFYFFEKSRSVLLNDRLNELNASSRLSNSDFEKEQTLRVNLFSSQQRLAELHPNTAEYGRVQQAIYENQQFLDDFIYTLEKRYPVYYQYRYNRSIPPLKNILTRLVRDNASLISYINLDQKLYAMVIKPDTAFLQVVDYPDYRKDFEFYLQHLAEPGRLNKSFSSYKDVAREIHDRIIKPFNFATRYLIVIQDDVFIPFEALITNQDKIPHFLVEDFIFSYSYSVSFLFNSENKSAKESSVLAMAPVDFAPSLSQVSLRGSDDALRKMNEYSFSVTYLTGTDASKKEFTVRSKQFDIVHLLTHADHQSKGEPMLFFSDSVLKVSDLQMFGRGKTKLISLFACHTASGRTISGEGTYSLARGFAAAGIPSTITTLWALDNEATYKMAEYFYRNIYNGMATNEALRQAKIDLMKSDVTYSLPYYWAGTVLVGASHRFEFKHDSGPFAAYMYLVVGAGLVIIALAGVFLVRRKKMQL